MVALSPALLSVKHMVGLLGKVPKLLLPDWQLTRGLHEGSILLVREAFSVGSIEGLSIAVFELGGGDICPASVAWATTGP